MEATASSDAYGQMDLLTAVTHELGHVLGLGHDSALPFMAEDLDTGRRLAPVVSNGRGSASGNLLVYSEAWEALMDPEELALVGQTDPVPAGSIENDVILLEAAPADESHVFVATDGGTDQGKGRGGLKRGIIDWTAQTAM
ncbi:MAG: hypothetical protein P8Y95_06285 [Gammaproteobacteria bacterium]